MVHLRGMGEVGNLGRSHVHAPSGARPTETRLLPTMSNGVLSALDVASNGEVKVAGGAGGSQRVCVARRVDDPALVGAAYAVAGAHSPSRGAFRRARPHFTHPSKEQV